MKDIIKNPFFYYLVAPLAAALWPILIWTVYLPAAENKWQNDKAQYTKAQTIIEDILKDDPERLEFTDDKADSAEFNYASAIEKIASLCSISPSNYKLSSGIRMSTSEGQKSQNANVSLKDVDMARFAKFLSTIQMRWANLQCTKITLKKKKGREDRWDIELGFKYYY